MLPAKDFFPDDAMAELWKALDISSTALKRCASIKREMAGLCVVLRPVSDRRLSWPETVRAALPACQKQR
jgi:hypothetical protein